MGVVCGFFPSNGFWVSSGFFHYLQAFNLQSSFLKLSEVPQMGVEECSLIGGEKD